MKSKISFVNLPTNWLIVLDDKSYNIEAFLQWY